MDSRGFAFVRYYSDRDAEDAIRGMDGRKIDGREIRVQRAMYGRPSSRKRGRYARVLIFSFLMCLPSLLNHCDFVGVHHHLDVDDRGLTHHVVDRRIAMMMIIKKINIVTVALALEIANNGLTNMYNIFMLTGFYLVSSGEHWGTLRCVFLSSLPPALWCCVNCRRLVI